MGGYHFGAYDHANALNTLHVAYEKGIRLFDSCDFYSKGESDNQLKKFLKKLNRTDYFFSYKGGLYWNGNTSFKDGSPKSLRATVENALRFFKSDYIDIFFLHWIDPNVDIHVSIEELLQLKKEHKILNWGVCNVDIPSLTSLLQYENGYIQQKFNPLFQQDKFLLSQLKSRNFTIFATSPFEHGFLVNPQYLSTNYFGKKDFRRKHIIHSNNDLKERLQLLFHNTETFECLDLYIITWLCYQKCIDGVFLGCRYPQQLEFLSNLNLVSDSLKEEEKQVHILFNQLYQD